MELVQSSEAEQSDGRVASKIPLISKTTNTLKAATLKANKTETSQSKISKRDVGKVSINQRGSIIGSKLVPKTKPIDAKKSTKSLLSLDTGRSTRAQSLFSARSTLNTQRSVKSKEITPRSQASTQLTEKSQKASDRAAAKRNMLAFTNMKEKVQSYQTEFMRKWEMVKDDLPHGEGEYKLIGVIKNSEGHWLANLTNSKVKINAAPKDLDHIKKDLLNNLNRILDSLDQIKTSSSGKIGDNSVPGLEYTEEMKRKIKGDYSNALEDMFKLIGKFEATESKAKEPTKDADLEAKITKLVKEVNECRMNLEQSQKELSRIKKGEEDNEESHKRELEIKDRELATKQRELDELKKSHGRDEKTNYRELHEKFISKSNEVEELMEKLKSSSQSNDVQQSKNQEHETKILKLESELKAALKEVEQGARAEQAVNDQATKHADEVRGLKDELMNASNERENLQKELLLLKKDAEKHSKLISEVASYRENANQAEAEIHNLRQNIKELESKVDCAQSEASVSRIANEELRRLKQNFAEQNQKIDLLEMELTKAHFQNQKLEEKIVMDRKLLKVRSNVIESLQTKEQHLKDLFAEVGERNKEIQMLKTEVLTKTEEFQNLFSTLGSKQLELTRQEHMIKLLQESNERAQTLRVKQEAKIGQLEEEIFNLKQTIALYQEAVLPNDAIRKQLITEVTRDIELNDNLGFYADERRRKRHININVKKYEK